MSPPKKRLRQALLCQGCRARKIRCDFQSPCTNCVKNNIDCIRIKNDRRKERFLNQYVENLHSKIENLENMIDSIKSIVNGENPSRPVIEPATESQVPVDNSKYTYPTDFENLDKHKNLAVYGPTSVFDNELIQNSSENNSEQLEIMKLNKNPAIISCIKIFFKWQYPNHNIFVFREAFIIDFFNPKPKSVYCSVELIYSICAMGSSMSDDDSIYSKSTQFYNDAKKLLLSKLDKPSITSMQSFLLLAFYDICNGNNSSGWMLSGNGIRMGFDLGFQLDPKIWFLTSNEKISNLNIAIRSRIFWGCYLADHFISLLLGRPSILKMSDSSIPQTKDLPDLEWIDEYSYTNPNDSKNEKLDTDLVVFISLPLKSLINLINISSNMLNDVFTRDHNNDNFNLSLKFEKLNNYNSQIINWKESLPDYLNWDLDLLKNNAEDPTLMNMRYYYYILLLCLNRPFIEITKQNKIIENNSSNSPSTICNEVLVDLIHAITRFKSVHGLRKASVFIVYCSILSLSVLILSNSNRPMYSKFKENLIFFLNVLHGCSRTWKLAEKSFKLIELKLEKDRSIKVQIVNDEVVFDIPLSEFESKQNSPDHPVSTPNLDSHLHQPLNEVNPDIDLMSNFSEFFGGPPVLMTSDLFDQDWASLFPDYSL